VLAIGEQPRPLAAGIAASMAVLTRPNLLPLALVVGVYLVTGGRRTKALAERSVVAFVAGLIPGGIILALLNWRMYGSPLASGYGSAGDLFQLANVVPNLDRYARWLWQTHTPVLALACVAPLLVARRAEAWLALALAGATILMYLPYRVFDDWWYIRSCCRRSRYDRPQRRGRCAHRGPVQPLGDRAGSDDCRRRHVVGPRRDRAARVRSSRVGEPFHRSRPVRAREAAAERRRRHP